MGPCTRYYLDFAIEIVYDLLQLPVLEPESAGSARPLRPLHMAWLSTASHIVSLPSLLSWASWCPASFAPFGGDGGRTGPSVTYRVTFTRLASLGWLLLKAHPEDPAVFA